MTFFLHFDTLLWLHVSLSHASRFEGRSYLLRLLPHLSGKGKDYINTSYFKQSIHNGFSNRSMRC
jgi:hypothetical protein